MSAQVVTCACGKVKIECPATPVFSAFCHCNECRVTTGAPFLWGAGYPFDSIKGFNESELISYQTVPGKTTTRHSCKVCGTFVFEKPGSAPLGIVPCVTMANPPPATMHIFVPDKVVKLPDDGLVRFAGMPGEGVEPMPANTF